MTAAGRTQSVLRLWHYESDRPSSIGKATVLAHEMMPRRAFEIADITQASVDG